MIGFAQIISLTVPAFLFNNWFWFAVIAVIMAIHYFWGKTPEPKKPSKFFIKHKNAITRFNDVFIVCVLLLCITLVIWPVRNIFETVPETEPLSSVNLKYAMASFFMIMTFITGFSGFCVGMLSIFQSNLTNAPLQIVRLLFPISLYTPFSALPDADRSGSH